jgi:hypothetical protein
MSEAPPSQVWIGSNPLHQTIELLFANPTNQIVLSPEQAEALANELLRQVLLLKVQQQN